MPSTAFHLALPVDDLDAAETFYGGVLSCPRGRSSPRWTDYDFYGHQLVVHKVDSEDLPAVARNHVDEDAVPASHFGVVLDWDDWDNLQSRLKTAGVKYAIDPKTRFAGRQGEQRTCFVRDPAGNHLEFKCFRNPEMLFATEGFEYK
ncbi:VOC family protein [Congregibacter brevis]|uniref:VOC family protein n=1 Tax=Congregibacter brevis TaxID=3081201 RepID=A0ABZ0ICX3_9GAMM|nr:VOC family protein [Congregibacter sp. IMCC45268]